MCREGQWSVERVPGYPSPTPDNNRDRDRLKLNIRESRRETGIGDSESDLSLLYMNKVHIRVLITKSLKIDLRTTHGP